MFLFLLLILLTFQHFVVFFPSDSKVFWSLQPGVLLDLSNVTQKSGVALVVVAVT